MQQNESYSRWRIWLLAARPRTLWAAVAPVIIGTAMAIETGGFHAPAAVAALLGGIMIQIGTNYANDYFDFKQGADTHERQGPLRVTQAGLVSPKEIKNAAIIAFTAALLIGVYLVIRGGWPIVIIGLTSIVCGVLYTAGPFALGYNGLGDLFVLIFFGPVAVGGTFYVQTRQINWPVILAGLAPGLLSVAILAVNNLRDMRTDAVTGKKTLAVRFGAAFAKAEYMSAIILASIIPFILWRTSGSHPLSSLAIITLLLAIPSIGKIFSYQTGQGLNKVLESTGQLLLFYSLLFSAGWLW